MDLLLNGEPFSVDQTQTVADLIASLDLDGKFAIELNQTIIPRSAYTNTTLHAGDKIEIVEAIGGG
jgi:sulfur carrier protein